MAVPQNSTVRWFTSDMPGAPELGPQAGSLISILDSCLINGFDVKTPDGSKISVANEVATVHISGGHDYEKHAVIEVSGATPAELNGPWRVSQVTASTFSFECPGQPNLSAATGSISVKRATPGYWEKPFGDALKGAYRSNHPDATGFFFRIDDSGEGAASSPIRGYESMSGIDDGVNAFPSLANVPDLTWRRTNSSSTSSGWRKWILVADAKMIYLIWALNTNTTSRTSQIYWFGDMTSLIPNDDYCCAIRGHQASSPGSGTTSIGTVPNTAGYNASGSFFARNATGNISGEAFDILGVRTPGTRSYPDPAEVGLDYIGMSNLPVFSGDSASVAILRSAAPGLVYPMLDFSFVNTEPEILIDATIGPAIIVFRSNSGSGYTTFAVDIHGPWK